MQTHNRQQKRQWPLLLISLLTFCISIFGGSFAQECQATVIQIDFSFDEQSVTGKQVSGYRLYRDSLPECEIGPSQPQQFNCDISAEDGTYGFTLVALYDNGSQSPHSASFPFTLTTQPADLNAVITADNTTGVAPLTVSLDSSQSTGSISSYSWSLGDGNTSVEPSVSHTYETPGTYTVSLTVADSTGSSDQDHITINVSGPATPPPGPNQPPTVILSSSAAVGVAPITVEFDGSRSYSSQSAITDYAWDFGDGQEGSGAIVSHTFGEPGNYSITLTITDNAGLSSEASTPLMVTQPNLEPTSSFRMSTASGTAPLHVLFDGSYSEDPDGNISEYLWDFGDGSTGTGMTTEHTFSESGEYTISLQVTDDSGAMAISQQTLSVAQPEDTAFSYEIGEISIDHNWYYVSFSQEFIDPVVVVGPPSYNGTDPLTVRIRNMDRNGFEIRLQEWDYLNGSHNEEVVSYLALEKGDYILPDGTKVEAGTISGNHEMASAELQQAYSQIPVILAQVVSENEVRAVTTRIQNVSESSFQFQVQEQESASQDHGDEIIGYIAWEPSQGELTDLRYQVATSGDRVNHNWFKLNFNESCSEIPFVIAKMQTTDSAESCTIRSKAARSNSIKLKVQEERSKERETRHTKENVGYISVCPLK